MDPNVKKATTDHSNSVENLRSIIIVSSVRQPQLLQQAQEHLGSLVECVKIISKSLANTTKKLERSQAMLSKTLANTTGKLEKSQAMLLEINALTYERDELKERVAELEVKVQELSVEEQETKQFNIAAFNQLYETVQKFKEIIAKFINTQGLEAVHATLSEDDIQFLQAQEPNLNMFLQVQAEANALVTIAELRQNAMNLDTVVQKFKSMLKSISLLQTGAAAISESITEEDFQFLRSQIPDIDLNIVNGGDILREHEEFASGLDEIKGFAELDEFLKDI